MHQSLVGQYGEPLVNQEVNIRGRILDFLIRFLGLGGVPIDRKLLGDRFGRILSPGSVIFVDFQTFSRFSENPDIRKSGYPEIRKSGYPEIHESDMPILVLALQIHYFSYYPMQT